MTKKILVIPDTHITANDNLERIEALSHFAYELKPDFIVDLGDFANLDSLSSYDRFKASTYQEDIKSVIKAQELFNQPWKFHKKKRPKLFRLLGNHEYRITRFINDYPEFAGFISLGDLAYHDFGWEVIHYEGRQPGKLELNSIIFAHYLTHQNTPNAISGKHHASALLDKKHMSCIVGHSHLFDYKIQTKADGSRIHGLVAGCYFNQFKSFAGLNNYGWWKGVHVLSLLDNPGEYDLRSYSLEWLMKEFSDD